MLSSVFISCTLLSLQIQDQQTSRRIDLRIVEKESGRAIPRARVEVNNRALVTDAAGRLTLTTTGDPISLRVEADGYLTESTYLRPDSQTDSAITIEMAIAEGEEATITVSATRTDARLQDLTTRVEVLGEEEIEEKIMMTPGDIVTMLNEMGGMRVQTTSPGLGSSSIRIQGMRGRYTRFLSDGLPLFGQQGGGLGLLQIPPTDLEQVEVIKGVSSALYGAGAMAGVVNLVARRPRKEPVQDILFNRTALSGTDAAVFLSGRVSPQWGLSLLTAGHFQDRYDRDGDRWADLAGYTRGLARPRFYFDSGKGTTGMLALGFLQEGRRGGTMPGQPIAALGGDYPEGLRTRRWDGGGSFQSTAWSKYVVAGRFSASRQEHRHQFGEIGERDTHELLFSELSVRGANGRHTWVAGVAADRDSYRSREVPRFNYTYVTPAFFAQDDFDVSRWLSVSASGRVDSHSRFGTFISPRLSALTRFAGFTSRVSLGYGFFAPTPITEETEAAGLSRLNLLAPLRAERGRSFSVDLSRRIGSGTYSIVGFTSRVQHPVFTARSSEYLLYNQPEPSRNSGLEFLATWRAAPFAITATYTFLNSRELDENRQQRQIPLTPKHSAGLVVMWEAEEKWRIGLEGYYTGTQQLEENPYRDRSPDYLVFGCLIERQFGPMRLFVNAENFTDSRLTRYHSLLRPGRAVDGRWTVDGWAPLDGRVINGGVRFRF